MFYKNILLNIYNLSLLNYKTPFNLNYNYNFGILAGLCLIIQIITGIILSMHYNANILTAFYSIEHIMRNINNGWLIRYIHANGASMFFFIIYLHIFRGIYYKSYIKPKKIVWIIGVIIFFFLIITAFIGYVLPWGQMSFWAATVITNLCSIIPFIGQNIVYWLWGGYSINNATLNRFFVFHFFFPFLILFFSILHIFFLHKNSSINSIGIKSKNDSIPFFPFFYIKDFFSIIIFFIFFLIIIFFYPNFLNHSDNFILANPLITPLHIVPEWYFLPFYAILRSISNKFFGVIIMLSAILILLILPYISKFYIKSNLLNNLYKFFFWIFFCNYIFLGWIGSQPLNQYIINLGIFCTFFYFFYFLILLPFTIIKENIVNIFLKNLNIKIYNIQLQYKVYFLNKKKKITY